MKKIVSSSFENRKFKFSSINQQFIFSIKSLNNETDKK